MKDDGSVKGDGRIYSRPRSPFYWMEFWQDGRQIRKSTAKTNKEDALKVLEKERQAVKVGDKAPNEERLTLRDLFRLLEADYKKKRRRSTATMRCSFQHFIAFFGEKAKAIRLGDRLDEYETHRTEEGASIGTLRIELSLLHRAYHLAVKKKRFSSRSVPDIELPPPDPSAVRKGFFRRATVEKLCGHLPDAIADVVLFLFFCPWRVGAARRLEWRDYDPHEQTLTLRPELNKTGYELQIPVDPQHTPELMAVIERQQARRRPDCPFMFHGKLCAPFATTSRAINGRVLATSRRSGTASAEPSGWRAAHRTTSGAQG